MLREGFGCCWLKEFFKYDGESESLFNLQIAAFFSPGLLVKMWCYCRNANHHIRLTCLLIPVNQGNSHHIPPCSGLLHGTVSTCFPHLAQSQAESGKGDFSNCDWYGFDVVPGIEGSNEGTWQNLPAEKWNIPTNVLVFKLYYSFWVGRGAQCCKKKQSSCCSPTQFSYLLTPFTSLLDTCFSCALMSIWVFSNLLTWQKIRLSLASASRLASWASSVERLWGNKAWCRDWG